MGLMTRLENGTKHFLAVAFYLIQAIAARIKKKIFNIASK